MGRLAILWVIFGLHPALHVITWIWKNCKGPIPRAITDAAVGCEEQVCITCGGVFLSEFAWFEQTSTRFSYVLRLKSSQNVSVTFYVDCPCTMRR
ncbi:hypothetical protein B0H11DRAFT_2072777 [Mycena galericulata]|nr:hypothetical protein B0H11DRAFT_2072777 [Mycena galericulata]